MDNESKRRMARILFVEKGKNAREIEAEGFGTQKTIGRWIKKYNWKDLRDQFVNGPKQQIANIKQLIGSLTERRLANEVQLEQLPSDDKDTIADLHRDNIRISDEVSKWNKTLENLDKANKVGLSVYCHVMEEIFHALEKYDPQLFANTLDFQEDHLKNVASNYQ